MKNGSFFLTLIFLMGIGFSQVDTEEPSDSLYFRFVPDSIKLGVGDSAMVSIQLLKNDGDLANNAFYAYGGERGTLSVYPRISDSTGVANVLVKVYKPGDISLNVRSLSDSSTSWYSSGRSSLIRSSKFSGRSSFRPPTLK